MSKTQSDDREASKARYDQLIQTVRQNTGGPGTPMRAGITRPHLALICVAHGSMTRSGFEVALGAALEDGAARARLVEYDDEAGQCRVACRTEGGLRAVVAEQNQRESPDVELQERMAEELREVTDA